VGVTIQWSSGTYPIRTQMYRRPRLLQRPVR
jgi:hypothetical protein